MIIPYNELPDSTLRNIIKENILRGVDLCDFDLENEIDKVKTKIANGDIKIVYSEFKQDVTLVSSEAFKKPSPN